MPPVKSPKRGKPSRHVKTTIRSRFASRPKPKRGRPTKYDPAKLPQVYELARQNQPDIIIARRVFGCARQVLVGWKSEYPALSDTIAKGHADYWQATVAEVECALTKTAKGEAVLETGTNRDGTTYVRFAQPNVAAQIFILCNRKPFDPQAKPDGWRNVQRVEVDGGFTTPQPLIFVVERGDALRPVEGEIVKALPGGAPIALTNEPEEDS